ncbi:MAG: NADH-quinone oxidoreductase subunit L [Chloroflexi bacterium]|nr:NADH-quinone oxidoreductase subunit L [Chloroflexota bacterium]
MADKDFRPVILAGCGSVDPESIDSYISNGGYSALRMALSDSTPESVIARVEEAGLRGRDGGFPVARKWRITREAEGDHRFVVANAYDADPLSPIGRTLLEQMPHRVLEGTIIAAYAIGADEGIIYCRGDGKTAVYRVRRAIAQAEEKGFLGPNALGFGRGLRVRLALGWAGFIGGEETAAIAAIEGRRAMPTQRPPFPAQSGLLKLPTALDSAETLAIIPSIAGAGRTVDVSRSAGTKVFSIQGSVRNQGLIELPLGLSLRRMIDHAGGTSRGTVKAVQSGGPTGACIPADALDSPISFESLPELGTRMGSGRIEVLDDSVCLVGFAGRVMSYLKDEACGKCVPCRLGTKRMAGIVEAIASGLGQASDLELLEDLSANVSAASICGFGVAAPCVVTSTLKHFRGEYLSHTEEKKCPTGECRPSRQHSYQRRKVL